jgi:membrane protein DedA with SNARE-associated domain
VPDWLVDLFARYGYTVVFLGVFLENTGLPVPGETALLAGAALAKFGRLSLLGVIVTAICGAILGDNLGFLIGRRGGRRLAVRHGPKIGLTAKRLTQFDDFFFRHGAKTVFLARFITGLRVFGAMLAGASGLRWGRFLFYNATGAVAWSTAVGVAGYSLAYSWEALERWIGRSGLMALAIIGILGGIAFMRRQPEPPPVQGRDGRQDR